MLMLDRKRGESVDLNDRASGRLLCTVKVLEVLPDGSVRLGFNADHAVHIKRDNMRSRKDGNGGNPRKNDDSFGNR